MHNCPKCGYSDESSIKNLKVGDVFVSRDFEFNSGHFLMKISDGSGNFRAVILTGPRVGSVTGWLKDVPIEKVICEIFRKYP